MGLLLAAGALDEQVRGLTGRAALAQPQRVLTAGRLDAAVHVVQPREVVEVAALAGEHEPGRHRSRPAVAVAAAAVRRSGPARAARGRSADRTARSRPGRAGCTGYRSSAASAGTAGPAPRSWPSPRTGRRSRACTAASAASPPAARAAPAPRPAAAPRVTIERVGQLPVVQPGDHDREVRQVGYRAHAVGVQQLIRPQFTHPQRLVGHGRHPHSSAGPRSAGAVAASNGGGPRWRRRCRPHGQAAAGSPGRRCAARSGRSSAATGLPPVAAAARPRHRRRRPGGRRPAAGRAPCVPCSTGPAGRRAGARPRC